MNDHEDDNVRAKIASKTPTTSQCFNVWTSVSVEEKERERERKELLVNGKEIGKKHGNG